jgi:hypothetical protein
MSGNLTYPGAILKLIPPGDSDPRIQPVGVVLHVAVSEADSLHDWFDGPSGGIESHLYVRYSGVIEEYRDLEHEADAQLAGHSWIEGAHRNGFLSVETEGMGGGTWTDQQIASLAHIVAWCSKQFDFPIRQVTTAQPSGPASGGVGYHSQWPSWNPNHHNCPGAARIAQIPAILTAAKAINNPPAPTPTPGEDMTVAELLAELKDTESPLSVALRNNVRVAVQAELADERNNANPGQ